MKTGKRVLSIFLAVLMLIATVPMTVMTKVKAEGINYHVGDIIEFGSYPQAEVTDNNTISILNSCASDWKSYGYYSNSSGFSSSVYSEDGYMTANDYMKYCDVDYNGCHYRGVTFSQYRPSYTGNTSSERHSNQDDNGYTTGTIYWFNYESLRWQVLDPSKGLVLCVSIIDFQPFNNYLISSGYVHGYEAVWGNKEKTYYGIDYANSSIRTWLNETFINTAFTGVQQNCIAVNWNQNNDGAYSLQGFTNYKDFDSAPTNDKVFLLSYTDVNNASYGFTSASTRRAYGTDYAKCQGLGSSNISSNWWLRTPGYYTDRACYITSDGGITGLQYGLVHGVSNCFGIRPAILIDLSAIAQQQTEEEYINKHLAFASATTMPEAFGFYNKIWNEENGRRLGWAKAWEVVGDIGEVATFKFDDLEISANFYDLFLSDMILKIAQQNLQEFELKAFDVYQKYYSIIRNALKSTEQWNKKVIEGSDVDLEIEGFLLDPDFKCSDNTYEILDSVFGDFFTNHADTFTDIFNGLNNAAKMSEYITDAADIVGAFQDAYKAYAVATACQEINDEFFTIMYQAANRMDNQTYASWFKASIDKYFIIANDGNANFEWSLSMFKDMAYMTYDRLFKDAFKNITYQWVAGLLNCSAGAVGIATFAYNTTYGLLDKVCKLDKKTKAYELMTYVAPVEKAMCSLEDDYAAILIGSQSLENAQNYDYFYNLYKHVNLYLYQAAYDFTSATFLRKNKAAELEVITRCTDQWKRSSCHAGLSAATVKKYSGVYCPVDVYAYNAEGETILEIINDEIVSCDESITAMTFDGKKSVVYPADQDYTIEIVAREDSEMNYYVSEIQDDTSVRQLEFYNIPISENQVFTGSVPEAFDISKEEYALSTNETEIVCNYDSKESSCLNGHTIEAWETSQPATCIEEGEKVGYCELCGKQVFGAIEISNHRTILQNAREATCSAEGYTGDQYCTVCEQTISTGTTIGKKAHTLTTINQKNANCTEKGYTGDQYCTVCKQTISTGSATNALGHTAPDGNGNCTRCGTHIKDVTPSQPQTNPNACKWCGKVHSGFFQSIVGFFHRILAAIFGAKY